MKKIAITAALLMVLCAAGCSSTTEQQTTTEASKVAAATTASEAENTTTAVSETTTTEAITTASEATTVITEATAAYSEKEQMVIDIARNGYISMVEKNYENALKYINFREGYFLTNGEWVSDEQVTERLIEATDEDDNNMFVWFAAMEDMEFLGTQRLTPEELQEYNDFIPEMADNDDGSYRFTDAYKVFVDYPAMSQSEKELIGTENAVHLLVVEADGQWKLDLFVSTFKEVMNSINELVN